MGLLEQRSPEIALPTRRALSPVAMSDSRDPEGDSNPEKDVLDGDIPRVHRPRRTLPSDVVRPTRADIHLAHLRHNLGLLRKAAGSVPIWAVLKADAYGHGAKAIARTLERAGIDGICVALVEEGIEIREAGIAVPILVMGGYSGSALRELSHHRLTPVLSDVAQVESLARALEHSDEPSIDCHVKVDTGMARLGTREGGWPDLVAALGAHPRLRVDGLMTHLANADVAQPEPFSEPLRLFSEASELFRRAGITPVRAHMANSAAVLRDKRTHFDLVRPGLALFGVDPLESIPLDLRSDPPLTARFKPTMTVHSRIVSLRTLAAGDPVGYGGTFKASGPTTIATVPMGYADGLARLLSNRGSMLVRGRRAPIVGNISMDMTMIDVSSLEGVTLGDEVVILGSQKGPLGSDAISAQEIAHWAETIPWEVLTNISRRVPRFYREA